MSPDGGDTARPDDPSAAATERGETATLDVLLRHERAALVVAVALAGGATTYRDRSRLTRLGGELVLLCSALRERLDLAGQAVPHDADPAADAMLATESYDARLTALADFLDAAAQRATTAAATSEDGEYTRTLRDLIAAHAQGAQWLRERAAAFATSRPRDETPPNGGTDAPDNAPAESRAGDPVPEK